MAGAAALGGHADDGVTDEGSIRAEAVVPGCGGRRGDVPG